MSWVGRPFEDPSGLVLGRVVAVEPDGTGGEFLDVQGEWGVLDWFRLMGAAHSKARIFRFHSTEVEEVEGNKLRLKEGVVPREPGREAKGEAA
jgi:hypothetical protein